MFHIFILFIFFSAFLGAVALSLISIVYSKEKYPIVRYFLVIIFLMTVLAILLNLIYYFYIFKMFQTVSYLKLAIYLVFYVLMSQWLMTSFKSKITAAIRLIDRINKVASFVLIISVIAVFFFFEHFLDFFGMANFFFGFISLSVNIGIVFSEKNNITYKDGVNWKLYTKIYLMIHVFLYLAYTAGFIIYNKGFDLYLYLYYSFAITDLCYMFICIFSIIFLFPYILRPRYNIRQASISSASNFDLTGREIEIASLLIEGMSYKSIGMSLFISEDTVKSHIKNLYRKTGANRRHDLIKIFQLNPGETDNKFIKTGKASKVNQKLTD